MLEKNMSYKNPSDILKEIVVPTMTVVSIILILVVYLFEKNDASNFIYAKPLFLILISIFFILFGSLIHILSAMTSNNLLCYFSLLLYMTSIVLFIISIDFLLDGVQGIDEIPFSGIVRDIAMNLFFAIFIILFLITLVYPMIKKKI